MGGRRACRCSLLSSESVGGEWKGVKSYWVVGELVVVPY